MERPVKIAEASRGSFLRSTLARLHQRIGWAGHTGGLSGCVAIAIVALGWADRQTHARLADAPQGANLSRAVPMPVAVARPATIELAPPSEIPLLVTQVEHAALAEGLAWSAAEFRQVAATPQRPPSLEIVCTLKGPYPRLRGALTQLLATVPGLTLGPLTMSRPASDVIDVEAKLAFTVFLSDETTATVPQQVRP